MDPDMVMNILDPDGYGHSLSIERLSQTSQLKS
jgi:hypothetical protein